MRKVLILFGGNSYEHNISCMSVNFIINNIDKKLFEYELVGINKKNVWYIVNQKEIDEKWESKEKKKVDNVIQYLKKFDIVFPVIHGNTFEDGKLQSMFEMNNIKYAGSDSFSSIICYDKLLTKLILEKYDIPQVYYEIYNKNFNFNKCNYPVIVKPCKCGSSIGINVANNKRELLNAVKEAKKYDDNVIIEEYLKNKRELECAIIQNKNKIIVSDVGEILNSGKYYSFDAKYKKKIKTKISNIDLKQKKLIKKLTINIFNILKCRSLCRIDFLYDIDRKKIYFNEVNTMPGLTDISMFPILINNEGITSKKMITILLNS